MRDACKLTFEACDCQYAIEMQLANESGTETVWDEFHHSAELDWLEHVRELALECTGQGMRISHSIAQTNPATGARKIIMQFDRGIIQAWNRQYDQAEAAKL